MRRLTLATLLLSGCFDWDVLSSNVVEPDLSVLDDLSVPADMSVADLSRADLAVPPDLTKPDMALPVTNFTKQADPTKFGGKKPNNAIFGWNTQNITAVGDGGVVVTTTDGTNWSLVAISGGFTQNIQDVWFSGDGSTGWFVGAGTSAYQWTSAGNSWQSKNAGLGGVLYSVFGTANDKVASAGDQNNKLYRFVTSWANDNNTPNYASTQNGLWGTGANFYSVSSAGADCLLITDAAITKVSCGTNGTLETVWGVDTMNVFAAGYENNTGIVSKYGGSSWKKETIPSVGKLWSVWAAGSKDVWVGGEAATLLHYDGTSWTQHNAVGIGATETIKDIWGADANNVWFLTDAGNIYKKN